MTPHMAAHTALTYPLHLLSSSWVFVVWNVWHAHDRLAYFNDENVARRERECNMGGNGDVHFRYRVKKKCKRQEENGAYP